MRKMKLNRLIFGVLSYNNESEYKRESGDSSKACVTLLKYSGNISFKMDIEYFDL